MKKEILLNAKNEILEKIAEYESTDFLAEIDKKVEDYRNLLLKEHADINSANLAEKKIELRIIERLIAKADEQEIAEEQEVAEEIAVPIAEEQAEETIEQEQADELIADEQPQEITTPIPTAPHNPQFNPQQINRPVFRPL